MSHALFKTGLIFGIPTLVGAITGIFLKNITLWIAPGFVVGLTIFSWIVIVKIRHIVRSVQQQYGRQPDNH